MSTKDTQHQAPKPGVYDFIIGNSTPLQDAYKCFERLVKYTRQLERHTSPTSAAPSSTTPTFKPDAKLRAKVAKAIDASPLLASLLYDIDLLPEQIKDERRYTYMLAVIGHMQKAMKP